jgi:hypothetical protein
MTRVIELRNNCQHLLRSTRAVASMSAAAAFACVFLILSIPSLAQDPKNDRDKCIAGEAAACETYAHQLLTDCSAAPLEQLKCAGKSQCYQDRAQGLRDYQGCVASNAANPAACDFQKNRAAQSSAESCENLPGIPAPPEISIWWFDYPTNLPTVKLLLGGHDNGQNADLYVCKVHVKDAQGKDLGVHPGKLLKNLCNYYYAGGGTEAHFYSFAVVMNKPGHWDSPHGDSQHMLSGGSEPDGTPLYVCSANYTEHGRVVNIGPIHMGGETQDEHGRQVGQLVGNECHFEFAGTERASNDDVQVYYLTPAPPPPLSPPPSPAPPPFQPRSCSIPPHDAFCGLLAYPAHVSCAVTCNNPAYPTPVCQPERCDNGEQFWFPLCTCK